MKYIRGAGLTCVFVEPLVKIFPDYAPKAFFVLKNILVFIRILFHIAIFANQNSDNILYFMNYISLMRRSNDKNMSTFGRNLWGLRKKNGLRQEDLAKALGISRDMISYYECKAKTLP